MGITHVVNCRARAQHAVSQDLWAERRVLGADRVAVAAMYDDGRPKSPRRFAPAVRFAIDALDADPGARVLVHCQQGRRRSAMVAYAILRLRGHEPADAAALVLGHRTVARLVPHYRASVEEWIARGAPALR